MVSGIASKEAEEQQPLILPALHLRTAVYGGEYVPPQLRRVRGPCLPGAVPGQRQQGLLQGGIRGDLQKAS